VITRKDRFVLAWNLVIQASRTAAARLGSEQMAVQLFEFTRKLFGDREGLDLSGVDPANAPDAASQQAMMMFSPHSIEIAKRLCNATFVFWWNRNDQPFFTSDHPVVTQDNSVLETVGAWQRISVRGAIMFPLSSRVVLGVLHQDGEAVVAGIDGKVIGIDDPTEPNAYQVMHSLRQVYCEEQRFELVERGLNAHPELGDAKREVVRLGTFQDHIAEVRARTKKYPPALVEVGDPVLVVVPGQEDGPDGGHVRELADRTAIVELLDGRRIEVAKAYLVPATEELLASGR
jgi:hypothetical protein